jgi:drug/metabolite transporter (DMT)-like permease
MEHHPPTTWDPLGESCALAAALTWAFALVLFKRSGERISPLALNLFKNVVGLVLLVATIVLTPVVRSLLAGMAGAGAPAGVAEPTFLGGIAVVWHFPREDIVILLLSGLLGIAVADTLFFYGLNRIGVGLSAIVDCLYSPFIILFSCLILSDEPGGAAYIGAGLILCGVLISSRHAPPVDRTRAQILLGMLACASAMASMTFGIVIATPVLEYHDFPLIEATTLRMLAGTGILALFALASSHRREYWSGFRLTSTWRVSIPASVLGSYFALIFWMGGFKYAKPSVAGILNQTSVIFAIILATVLLKENFTRRKFVAVTLAMCGVVLVTLYRS